MLGSDPGEWRRTIKALVAGLDPDVAVLIGRGNSTGHHPVRFTLETSRETLYLYDDQVVALPTDAAVRATIQQEVEGTLALLRLKVQIVRTIQQAQPSRGVAIVGPLPCPGGEVGVELRRGAGLPVKAARGRTYNEALQILHQQLVTANPPPRR